MIPYVLEVEGLDLIEDFDTLDDRMKANVQKAVNRAIDRARTLIDRDIRSELNIRKSDLAKRIGVVKRATIEDPEGVIRASSEATSLAYYKTSNRKRGVTVKVSADASKEMSRAFLMFNGKVVAMRLNPGETFRNKKYVRQMDKGLYALYGPSVDQAFRVSSEDQLDDIAAILENEFLRLQGTDI